jgi:hypothetical protein
MWWLSPFIQLLGGGANRSTLSLQVERFAPGGAAIRLTTYEGSAERFAPLSPYLPHSTHSANRPESFIFQPIISFMGFQGDFGGVRHGFCMVILATQRVERHPAATAKRFGPPPREGLT